MMAKGHVQFSRNSLFLITLLLVTGGKFVTSSILIAITINITCIVLLILNVQLQKSTLRDYNSHHVGSIVQASRNQAMVSPPGLTYKLAV